MHAYFLIESAHQQTERTSKLNKSISHFVSIVSEKTEDYEITVVTGKRKGAGTDASVTLIIKGKIHRQDVSHYFHLHAHKIIAFVHC